MGKKGGKGKGKPVVMTQAEFFNQATAGTSTKTNSIFGSEEIKSEWGKGDIFKPSGSNGNAKVIKATEKAQESKPIIPQ